MYIVLHLAENINNIHPLHIMPQIIHLSNPISNCPVCKASDGVPKVECKPI